MPGCVVTPLDGSSFGELALPFAGAIADRTGAKLHLLHVHVPDPRNRTTALPGPGQLGPPTRRRVRARRTYLARTARRYGLNVGSTLAVLAEDAGVAATIGRQARRLGADLIVMSAHGRTGMNRMWLGSVADALVRCSGIPVLFVRPPRARRTSVRLARMERVLVPLDTTACGDRILEPAMELGDALGWSFVFVHVVPTHLVVGARSYPIQRRDEQQRIDAEMYLERVADRFRKRGLPFEVRIVEEEAPAGAIVRIAVEDEIDMVAMATHGHGGLTRAILGSVTDRVLRGTSLPILLEGPRPPTAEVGDVN